MTRRSTDPPSRPSGILVEIRQGGRLIAALPLGAEPIDVTLRDIQSGLPLGTLSARGPQVGHIDEPPVPRLARVPDDDFTMPHPEVTDTFSSAPTEESTGDLDGEEPETVEAPRPSRPRERKVPNLAQSRWTDASDEATSPAMAPRTLPPPDEESSLTIPRPTAIQGLDGHAEETLSAHLIDASPPEHTLSDHLEDSLSTHLRPVPPLAAAAPATVPPAEVWTRNASEWRSAGRLTPGARATARRGWVSLEQDGRLIVHPGPELAGTATLVDGSTIEIRKGGQRVRLPPGSSVILRGPGHGLYVRADPPHAVH